MTYTQNDEYAKSKTVHHFLAGDQFNGLFLAKLFSSTWSAGQICLIAPVWAPPSNGVLSSLSSIAMNLARRKQRGLKDVREGNVLNACHTDNRKHGPTKGG